MLFSRFRKYQNFMQLFVTTYQVRQMQIMSWKEQWRNNNDFQTNKCALCMLLKRITLVM